MNVKRSYQKFSRRFWQSGLVLMYHRIASPLADPWQLAVSPENFEGHLQVLQKSNRVVSLSQLVNDRQNNLFRKKKIAISFDDGYIDNFTVARPLLEKYGLPATLFITTCNIDSRREFWWDELERIILQTQELPQVLELPIGKDSFFFDLKKEKELTDKLQLEHSNYLAFNPPTLRSQLYFSLWELLSPLVMEEQQKVMGFLRSWAGITPIGRKNFCSMSSDQVIDLASNRLFQLGGHTHSHPALDCHNLEFQRNEIRNNKIFLENLTGKQINMFAYPSGRFNEVTIEILKEEGYSAAFTTKSGCISSKDDPYQLNRIQVINWNKTKFEEIISNI